MPPAAPVTQRSDPVVLVAPRGLFPSEKSLSDVDVSMLPEGSTRPNVRWVDDAAVPARFVELSEASYPVRRMYCPSVERVIWPSEVAFPEATRRWLAPLAVVGRAIA